MDEEKKEQGKKCFIITPIGSDGSETFRKAKGVIDSVIKPILQRNGFDDIKPAYEIADSGMIGNQIVNRIVNDDLVVANLTGNNPNVMYELAIRHASAKPIIHICEIGTVLPFDIKDNRTIFYTDDMLGVQELQNNFEAFVKKIDYCKEYIDNPIYSGIKMGTIFKKMYDGGQQDQAEILQEILNKVSNLSRANNIVLCDKSTVEKEINISFTVECDDFNLVDEFMKELRIQIKEITKISCFHLYAPKRIFDMSLHPGTNISKVVKLLYKIASEFGIIIIEHIIE